MSKSSDSGKNSEKNNSEITIKFEGSEILERTVSKFGTGCHVIVPKEYEGKNVKIIFEDNSKNKISK